MSVVMIVIYTAPLLVGAYALTRQDKSFQKGLTRGLEQFAIIVPRMICALIGAEFMAMMVPAEVIARFLGNEAGLLAILIGSFTGLLIPAGPIISFSIAATFAKAGASTPAVIAFLTAWSVFTIHRILIYEVPLLGVSFLRLRLLSVAILPVTAGILVLTGTQIMTLLGF
ncbi:MAG: hypothetical protein WD709_00155 [Gammaproteobacteria bacterium]